MLVPADCRLPGSVEVANDLLAGLVRGNFNGLGNREIFFRGWQMGNGMNKFFQVCEKVRMILKSGEILSQGFNKGRVGFEVEEFIFVVNSEPVIEGLEIEVLFIHFTIKFPAGFIAKSVLAAMLVSKRFFKLDITVGTLALKA